MLNKIRKRIAEIFFELAFFCLPKMRSENYLEDKFYGLNMKYCRVQVSESDGSKLKETT